MKRILSLFLVGMMTFSVMAGCKKADETEVQNKDTASKDTTPDYMNATGYPIVKQPITIKVMGSKSASHGEWKDMKLFKKMEELTGIHMEFDTPIATAYAEKRNLALASGDVPDVFLAGSINVNDEEAYGPQGVFLPLESYLDKYSPNLKKTFDKMPDAKNKSTATDGHIYSLPSISDTKTRAAAILYLNMDWVSNVGMKKPTNVDEFYNVLMAFKEKDPNKNGKQDEIPLSYFKILKDSNILYKIFVAAFTGQTGGVGFDVKDNKVIYNPIEANFKDFLTYMNKLYTDGLLDKDLYTQSVQQMAAKYKEGKMGISSTTLATVLGGSTQKVNYEIIAPLTSSKNSKMVAPKINFVTTGSFVITNKCKYPEAMMRWIDVMYLDVDHAVNGIFGMMNFLGEYGVDWKYDNDKRNTYSILFKLEGTNQAEYIAKFIAPQGFGNVSTPAVAASDALQLLKAEESDKNYHPYMKEFFPSVRYKAADQEKLTLLENDLNTYVEQMIAKFIVGEEPLTKFDEFQNKMKKDLKIDEIIKIRQAAYDAKNVK